MTRLPVRTGADVHLADAFGLPGCPLCRERERSEGGFLESILAESVNDVGFRRTLDEGRGFCGRHAAAILDADRRRAGSLGAAILLRATLVPRLRDLEAATTMRGRRRAGRVADAARPPACPACERLALTDAGRLESLVALTAQPAWADAAAGAPICLEHLLGLMAVRPAPAAWAEVEASQLRRLARLRDLLDGFAHTSSQDRRDRQTDEQRASPDLAAALFAGGTAASSRPAARSGRRASVGDATTLVGPIPPDARAVVITGVYGAGKTSTAIEVADRLEAAGAAVAAIDLDWLGWFAAPIDWDEHDDPRIGLANLAVMRATYLEVGVRAFVLAGRIRTSAHLAALRDALVMPLAVVRLEVPIGSIEARLRNDPNASRADDLRVAATDIAAGSGGLPPADWVIDGDRPVVDVADDVLGRLAWSS